MNTIKKTAMQKIRDATDNSGGATFPTYMLQNMKAWEREGLIEIHIVGADKPCARITNKGRQYAGRS